MQLNSAITIHPVVKNRLIAAGLAIKKSYNEQEFCKVAGIKSTAFFAKARAFREGHLDDPKAIKTFKKETGIPHTRVPVIELNDYILRNQLVRE